MLKELALQQELQLEPVQQLVPPVVRVAVAEERHGEGTDEVDMGHDDQDYMGEAEHDTLVNKDAGADSVVHGGTCSADDRRREHEAALDKHEAVTKEDRHGCELVDVADEHMVDKPLLVIERKHELVVTNGQAHESFLANA